MQESDWGQHTQTPWTTNGAWKDTPGSKKTKTKTQPARISTPKHASEFTSKKARDEDEFQTEVDLAHLNIKLRRWKFARSWGRGSPADEAPVSPRSRIEDVNITENHRIGTGSLVADRAKKHKKAGHDEPPYLISEENTQACGSVDPPLDGQLVGRYLDGCIAAAEAQLAGKGGEVRRREAVREIERLVGEVVARAGLGA